MKTQKINIGSKPEVSKTYGYKSAPTTKEDHKQLIRDAHARGYLQNLKIKDYEIIQRYLQIRSQKKESAKPTQIIKLQNRLKNYLVKITPNTSYRECNLQAGRITDYDKTQKLWIISCSKYLYTYKEYKDIYRDAMWLCGRDDGHIFVHQIPSTITKIEDALAWIRPAAVDKAIKAGKKVLRQGDIWFVEHNFRCDDTRAIPAGHNYNPQTRDCVHAEHGTLHIPFNFRAYQNKSQHGKVD